MIDPTAAGMARVFLLAGDRVWSKNSSEACSPVYAAS